jgi:hypothetical protein
LQYNAVSPLALAALLLVSATAHAQTHANAQAADSVAAESEPMRTVVLIYFHW